jgi:hypothetical protein
LGRLGSLVGPGHEGLRLTAAAAGGGTGPAVGHEAAPDSRGPQGDAEAYHPELARNDFRDRWGTDDLSCLSRYDGLMFFRINSLGAWCLGLAEQYEAEAVAVKPVLKVLPNLDVVTSESPLTSADVLLLERFCERPSDAVWHLERAKILAAVSVEGDGPSVCERITLSIGVVGGCCDDKTHRRKSKNHNAANIISAKTQA